MSLPWKGNVLPLDDTGFYLHTKIWFQIDLHYQPHAYQTHALLLSYETAKKKNNDFGKIGIEPILIASKTIVLTD